MDIPEPIRARYALTVALGRGAQGSVFRGSLDGRSVAVKIVRCGDDERRIRREIDLLRATSSSHLSAILDSTRVEEDKVVYWAIAYELIEGTDLRSAVLDAKSPLSGEEAANLAASMFSALEELWKARVVHRDVKPANIMRSGARFVLVDLGLARFLDLSSATGAGLVAGTPIYMSPEQVLGRRDLTINSDLFGLGITLFELLTLRHPFGSDVTKILRTDPEDLGAIRATLPRLLAEGIAGVLDKRPSVRLGAARRCFAGEKGA